MWFSNTKTYSRGSVFPSPSSSTSFPWAVKGNWEWRLRSAHNTSSLLLRHRSLHSMLSFLNWCPVGFPQAAAFQAMLQYSPLPQSPPFRTILLQYGSSLRAALSPPATPWAPLHGLQLWQDASCGYAYIGYASFRPYPLLHRGLLHGCTRRSACVVPMGCRGTSCSTKGFSWAAGSLCSVSGAPPALTLVAAEMFLSCFFYLLSPSCCCAAVIP